MTDRHTEHDELIERIKPILAGHDPSIQSTVLADLLSMWVVGHAPPLREPLLTLHMTLVHHLITVNDKILFGDKGHPGA